MTLADHTSRAQLRLLESTVVPLHEPSLDEELCREAALRLRAAAEVWLPGTSQRLWDAADFIERGDADAVRAARRLLGRDLGPGAA